MKKEKGNGGNHSPLVIFRMIEDQMPSFLSPDQSNIKIKPLLPPIIRPVFFKVPTFDADKLKQINTSPIECFSDVIASLGEDPLPEEIAKLLFFSPITTHAITKLLFSHIFQRTFLKTYLSAPIIEFMPFINSLRILFSRIAIPYRRNDLFLLLEAIGSIIYEKCNYTVFGSGGLTHVIASVLYVSVQHDLGETYDLEKFNKILQYHPKLKSVAPSFLQSVFSLLKEEPFAITYAFSNPSFPPDLKKNGNLNIPKFNSWHRKSVFAELDNFQIIFYKDSTKQKKLGGVPLVNVVVVSPAKEDIPNSITVLTEDMKPTGYAIESSGPSVLTEQLIIKTNSKEESESWRSSIAHHAFIKMFANMLQLPQWK